MTSTREQILKTILSRQQCTINELAEAVGINPISVRHHIIKLQADGIVDSEEERHGVGRPRRVYFLTEAGQEHFPTRYLKLTNRLLDQLKGTLPASTVDGLFTQMAEELAMDVAENRNLTSLSIEERLDILRDILQKEGFSVEWQKRGDEYHIKELNCPYYHIGQSHPEVCAVDQTLISLVLSVPAKKIKCLLHGDSHCTYVVPTIPLKEISVI